MNLTCSSSFSCKPFLSSRRATAVIRSCSRCAALSSLIIAFSLRCSSLSVLGWFRACRALMTFEIVKVAPVFVLTAIMPFSTTVPPEMSSFCLCLNKWQSSLYVSTTRFGLLLFSIVELVSRVIFSAFNHFERTAVDEKSSARILVGPHARVSMFYIPERLKSPMIVCATTYFRYAKQRSLHIVKIPFLVSFDVYMVLRIRTQRNSSFRGQKKPTSRGCNTCDLCAGTPATITPFSFNNDKYLKDRSILP